ncbi:MAG: hypothetical protein KDE32_00895 [Novosphingobium sp.]|nr:hypothetical protein [Novosphingobium sp.]
MIRRFYIMPLNHRATEDSVAQFIADYDACDQFIPGLTASAAGLDFGGSTVVWENVFDTEETYLGMYMVHPYHACTLDSYLMADSPELLTQDTFTVRYELDGDIPRLERGIRRLVLMKLPEDAETAAEKYLSADSDHVATSVFSPDNVKWVSPKGKAWTHILEQGFVDEDDLDAYLASPHGIATSSKDGFRRAGIDIDDLKIFTYPFELKSNPVPAPLPADDVPAYYAITAQLNPDDVDAYLDLLKRTYDPHMTDQGCKLVQRLRTVDEGYLEAEVQSIWELPSVAHYNPMRFASGGDANWNRYALEAATLVKGGRRRFYRAV